MCAASVTSVAKTSGIPLAKRFFPGSRQVLSIETCKRVLTIYRELYARQPLPANAQLRWHLVEGVLPGLALYRVIRESGEPQDEALRRVDEVFARLFAGDAEQMRLIGRLPFALLLLRVFLKPLMRRYPAEGWTIEWRQNSSDGIRFDMTACYYHRTLSDLGAPELTAAFCRVDDLMYSTMARHVSWQRSMTIAGGDPICDFCFASTRPSRPRMGR
jgi:hypothetical protein